MSTSWRRVGPPCAPARTHGSSIRAARRPVTRWSGRSSGRWRAIPTPRLRGVVRPGAGRPPAAAHGELARILGIRGSPLWSRAFTWPRGLPRYKPGHARHVAAVRERLARLPPLAIAGAGFDRSEEHTSELQSHSFISY